MPAQLGSGKLRAGAYLNEKGYVRFTVGSNRGKYEHRVVIAKLCAEFCYWPLDPRTGIPSGMSVEHLDHRKTHNCPSNLLLLDELIHNVLSSDSRLAQEGRSRRWRHNGRESVGRNERDLPSDEEIPF